MTPTTNHAPHLIAQALNLAENDQHIDAAVHFDAAFDAAPELFEQFNGARFSSVWRGFKQAQDGCDWRHYDRLQRLLSNGVAQGMWVIGEMTLAAPLLSNLDLLTLTSRHAKSIIAETQPITPFIFRRKNRHEKIKIGFVGADFFNQATAYLLTEAMARIDRTQFEVFAYDFGLTTEGELRERSFVAYDHVISIHDLSDADVARLIHADEIDILFSIKNPASARLGIFVHRPAPLQVHYLYFPGTSGMPFFDGFVADHVVVPPELEYGYAEKIWRIEGCYQPNDETRVTAVDSSKADWGLPEHATVLANMSQCYKITPTVFDLWMRILLSHPNCVLWLLAHKDEAVNNRLRFEAAQRGVDPSRLYFSLPMGVPEHLARLRCADVILDTFPYGGHTLTSDALWAGTPVVTMVGETYASRVAASLLSSVGLSELVTYSPDGYVRAISQLIHDAPRRIHYRQHLTNNRHQFDLFSSTSYARRFENMLRPYVAALRDE